MITNILLIYIITTTVYGGDSPKIIPRDSFEFNSRIQTQSDSLWLVTCADYVYFPFGKLNSNLDLPSSPLKAFAVTASLDTMVNGIFQLHRLRLGSSHMVLWFDDDSEATIHSYILKGQIQDKAIRFINGVHVGIGLHAFLSKFLISFPNETLNKCSTVILESCIEGIRHVYSFRHGKLISVRFDCVRCMWKL